MILLSIITIVSLIIGTLFGLRLASKFNKNSTPEGINNLETKIFHIKKENDRLIETNEKEKDKNSILIEQKTTAENNLLHERQRNDNIEKLRQEMTDVFKLSSNTAMSQQTDELKKKHQEWLTPQINDINERFIKFNNQQVELKTVFNESFTSLNNMNLRIENETKRLRKVLTTPSKAQGTAVEDYLEVLLNGFHIPFEKEKFHKGVDGEKSKIPDFKVNIGVGKTLFIDAKATLFDYDRACEFDDNSIEKTEAMKKHIVAIKSRIDNLSSKNYEALDDNSPNFVYMFLPSDGALIEAQNFDSKLIEYAITKRVSLVSPALLGGMLFMASYLWKVDKQLGSVKDILKVANTISDKINGVVDGISSARDGLKKADDGYQKVITVIEGKGGILSCGRTLSKLQAGGKKSLEQNMKDKGLGLQFNDDQLEKITENDVDDFDKIAEDNK
ncbi:MAG: DNA recombination protein RmuC [Alphaproteobacteria bacterium]|nr:DNA recombination protein RmuC [Alphaproteobacteria bacterium]MBL0717755.1 DNA recombination protein RmuC [Alphaproteobacteria bacterium]